MEHRETPQPRFSLLVPAGILAALISFAFYITTFVLTRAWQVLIPASALLVGFGFIFLGQALAKRGRALVSGYVTFLVFALIYCCTEIAFSGLTLPTALSGMLVILIAGPLVLPRRWPHWILAAAICGGLIATIGRWSPSFRYDARLFPPLPIFVFAITGLLAVGFWGQFLSMLWSRTISTRLLVSFVSVVALTAALVGGGSTFAGWQNGQTQARQRLQMAVEFKSSRIDAWIQSLKRDLDDVLVQEGMADYSRSLLMWLNEGSETADVTGILRNTMRRLMLTYLEREDSFDEIFLLSSSGRVIVSSGEAMLGQTLSDQLFFHQESKESFVQPPSYFSALNDWIVIVGHPIFDDEGQLLGVLAARTNLDGLNEILSGERVGLGDTGETYLVEREYRLLTDSRFEGYPSLSAGGETVVQTQGTQAALSMGAQGLGTYQNYRGQTVIGVFRYLPSLGAALLAEQEQAEALRETSRAVVVNVGVAIVAILVASLISLFIIRSIALPISDLAQTASQIANGDITMVARVGRMDEVGLLAQNFNRMTAQLRESIIDLEQRVSERTQALEEHSAYLEASAEVGRVVASILNLDELIRQVVTSIQERFGFYYVGLFLVDELGEWAVLRAGTGRAGQAMLARGHRVRVGEGMIGWCIANNQMRKAMHADEDEARQATPELPDARSEVALALHARGNVIGALTVQSTEPEAFSEDVLSVLQTMADQIALAIDNARLLAESESAVQAARRAYGEFGTQAWAELLRARPEWGYRYSNQAVAAAQDDWRPELRQAVESGELVLGQDVSDQTQVNAFVVAIPLRVRGQVVGALRFRKDNDLRGWTREQIALLETLVGQLAQALEVAQLYESTQRQAAREQAVGQISAEFARVLDLDALLRTAVQELGRLPDVTEVSVHVDVPEA